MRSGWKQYVWASDGPGCRDYWQRDDGNAEVFSDSDHPGYFRANVWKPYSNGPRKQTGATGHMVTLQYRRRVRWSSCAMARSLADRLHPAVTAPGEEASDGP